jgi:penicillin-binding protein 2
MITNSRIIAIYSFVISVFIILLMRYGYLQLVDHGVLLQQSIRNYSSAVAAIPVRGSILDHNGVVLADSTVSYAVAVLPKYIDKTTSDELFTRLNKFINLTELDKKKYYLQLRNAKNYDWVIIKDDLSNIEVANLTAHNYEIPEVSIFARTKRYYPFDELYANSIGYVGRISSLDRQKITTSGKVEDYLANDYIGKSGLEQYYENYLRGKLGRKVIQTDVIGNEVGLISNNPAVDGYSLKLTLDNGLQKLAWQLLGNRRGAIVALDPQTGGVLAFISKPSFNPNWFIEGISIDNWDELRNDPDKPLLNRASQGSYPPGSTFKPFMALSALHLGFRSPSFTIFDPGYFSIPGSTHRFRDVHKNGRGLLDMSHAIMYSSDTYFYKLGLEMGIDRIDQVMPYFGFGKKSGIDLPNENTGLLPSRSWKAKRFAKDSYQKNWLPADSVTIGIGQGFNNYTPLQMAVGVSTIANEGTRVVPHFMNMIIDKNGHTVYEYSALQTQSPVQTPISKANFAFIKNAMQKVVMSPGGGSYGISSGLRYTMAGKTGTAQVVAMEKNSRKAKFSGNRYKDHSWFIAFAPVDKPKIAIAVIVENGGFGLTAAAPIARKMFDYYILGPSDAEENQYKTFLAGDDSQNADTDSDTDEDENEDNNSNANSLNDEGSDSE